MRALPASVLDEQTNGQQFICDGVWLGDAFIFLFIHHHATHTFQLSTKSMTPRELDRRMTEQTVFKSNALSSVGV